MKLSNISEETKVKLIGYLYSECGKFSRKFIVKKLKEKFDIDTSVSTLKRFILKNELDINYSCIESAYTISEISKFFELSHRRTLEIVLDKDNVDKYKYKVYKNINKGKKRVSRYSISLDGGERFIQEYLLLLKKYRKLEQTNVRVFKACSILGYSRGVLDNLKRKGYISYITIFKKSFLTKSSFAKLKQIIADVNRANIRWKCFLNVPEGYISVLQASIKYGIKVKTLYDRSRLKNKDFLKQDNTLFVNENKLIKVLEYNNQKNTKRFVWKELNGQIVNIS